MHGVDHVFYDKMRQYVVQFLEHGFNLWGIQHFTTVANFSHYVSGANNPEKKHLHFCNYSRCRRYFLNGKKLLEHQHRYHNINKNNAKLVFKCNKSDCSFRCHLSTFKDDMAEIEFHLNYETYLAHTWYNALF